MNRKGPFIVFRLIGALLLVGLMIGGAVLSYRAGYAQGVAQAPQVAKAISQAAESGQLAPAAPMYGYPYPYTPGFYPYPHFGFFPFGGFLGAIFLVFLFFGLLRIVFFRGMMWGHHGSGHWRHGPHGHDWGGPPWMRGDKEESNDAEKKADETQASK